MLSLPHRLTAITLIATAAVLAGAYQDFHDAQKKMTSVQAKSYRPIAANRGHLSWSHRQSTTGGTTIIIFTHSWFF